MTPQIKEQHMSHAPEFGQGEGTLSRAAGMVTDARSDFNRISNELSGEIAELRGKWGGQGASAFHILHDAWQEKQKVIVDALDEFSTALHSTEKDNIATDEAEGASFGKLHGRLG
jgi:WXG100 family type VII secretion target